MAYIASINTLHSNDVRAGHNKTGGEMEKKSK